ncbi:MAG: hypothetical protein ABI389_01580 [Rhodanobacter sp.]
MKKALEVKLHRVHADPKDARRILLDDGRPAFVIVGGGHDNPFTQAETKMISEWVVESWNARAWGHRAA